MVVSRIVRGSVLTTGDWEQSARRGRTPVAVSRLCRMLAGRVSCHRRSASYVLLLIRDPSLSSVCSRTDRYLTRCRRRRDSIDYRCTTMSWTGTYNSAHRTGNVAYSFCRCSCTSPGKYNEMLNIHRAGARVRNRWRKIHFSGVINDHVTDVSWFRVGAARPKC
jgi:hypothetical protein